MSTPIVKTPSTAALVVAFATIYLAWGSTYLAMKLAVETMPPFAMAAVRFAVAGVVLLLASRARGHALPTARQWRDNAGIGLLLLLGGNGLVAWAGQFMPSGVTAVLVAASPLFMVLAEWAWPGGTRPGARVSIGLLIGFAGAAWLAAPWEQAGRGGWPVAGLVATLGACVSWALGSIASRRQGAPAPVLVASAVQMIGGAFALGGVSVATGECANFAFASVSRVSLGAWFYLVAVSIVAFPTYAWLMRHSTPARVSTYAYVNPVVALVLGWLLLDEAVGVRTMVAAALIIGSVVWVKLPGRSEPVQIRADRTRPPEGGSEPWLRAIAVRMDQPRLSRL